jgi:hypothetical protein
LLHLPSVAHGLHLLRVPLRGSATQLLSGRLKGRRGLWPLLHPDDTRAARRRRLERPGQGFRQPCAGPARQFLFARRSA